MDGVKIEVVPCFEIADVPPEMWVLARGAHNIDTFDEVNGWVGTGEILLESRLRLVFGYIDEVG